jgi:hypothetical protein
MMKYFKLFIVHSLFSLRGIQEDAGIHCVCNIVIRYSLLLWNKEGFSKQYNRGKNKTHKT